MPRQIGWSQESNLLYNISMQLDRLAAVTAAAGGGGGGTITGGGASGQITFWNGATSITGSNNLFWDNVNKRMGVGTNTPLTIAAGYTVLALNGTIGGVLEFQSNGTRIATINNNSSQLDIETKTAAPITFGTNGSERMRVDSVGNVGIGINTPAYKTHIVNESTSSQSLVVELFSSTSSLAPFVVRRGRGTYSAPSAVQTDDRIGGFLGGGYYNGGFFGYSGAISLNASENYTSTANGSYITFEVTPNGTLTRTKAMQIFNTTNVVLQNGGTFTDNGQRLQVYGDSLFSGGVSITGKLALTVVTNRQTVNYSLVLADNGKLVEMNVGAANTLTVPPNSSIAFPIGTKIDIAQYGAGQTSIVPGVGVTVRSALGALKLAAQYSGASLVKIGTDEWYLFGDITV